MPSNKVARHVTRAYRPSDRHLQRTVADQNDKEMRRLLNEARQRPVPPPEAAPAAAPPPPEPLRRPTRQGRCNWRNAATAALTLGIAALLLRRCGADPTSVNFTNNGLWTFGDPFQLNITRDHLATLNLRHATVGTPVLSAAAASSASNLANSSLVAAPLQGCAMLQHPSIQVQLGAQLFNANLDSGSSDVVVVAEGCDCTDSIDVLYAPGATAKNLKKSGEDAYGTGANKGTGTLYQDNLAVLGAPDTFRAQLLAVEDETYLFGSTSNCSAADQIISSPYTMILGVGTDAAAASSRYSFAGLLARAGHPHAYSVSLNTQGGSVTWGGYNPSSVTAPPQFVPMQTTSSAWYSVNVADVLLDGNSTLSESGATMADWENTLVDTGTPWLVMPPAVYNRTIQMLRPTTDTLLGTGVFNGALWCVQLIPKVTEAQINAALPTLSLGLADSSSTEPAIKNLSATESYLAILPLSAGGRYLCNALASSDAVTGHPILGASIMRGSTFILANDRLGIAPAAANFSATAGLPPPQPVINVLGAGGLHGLALGWTIAGSIVGGSLAAGCMALALRRCCKFTAKAAPVAV